MHLSTDTQRTRRSRAHGSRASYLARNAAHARLARSARLGPRRSPPLSSSLTDVLTLFAIVQSAPLYTRLTAAATSTHLSTLSQRERARLSSLARLTTLRVARASGARAEAERGLRELEEAWGAVLALEEGETEGEQGEGTLEAREARARAAVVACMEDGESCAPLLTARCPRPADAALVE